MNSIFDWKWFSKNIQTDWFLFYSLTMNPDLGPFHLNWKIIELWFWSPFYSPKLSFAFSFLLILLIIILLHFLNLNFKFTHPFHFTFSAIYIFHYFLIMKLMLGIWCKHPLSINKRLKRTSNFSPSFKRETWDVPTFKERSLVDNLGEKNTPILCDFEKQKDKLLC